MTASGHHDPARDDSLPRVSVVVPTHARPGRLRSCVAALALLDYPGELLDVIVVDDGTPTPVAETLEVPPTLRLRIERQSRGGPGAARNLGAGTAQGAVIAFIDDDCAPTPLWLRSLVAALGNGDRRIVGGTTVNALAENVYAEASQALLSYILEYYARERPERMFFATNNLAMRRDQFLAVGGFDVRFERAAGEDREFCGRCTSEGFSLIHAPDALVLHSHALTPRGFWRQQFAYGRAAHRYHRTAERAPGGGRHDSIRFHLRLIAWPLKSGRTRRIRMCILFALAQAANTLGYAWESARSRGRGL